MSKLLLFICAVNCFSEGWLFTAFVMLYVVLFKEFKK